MTPAEIEANHIAWVTMIWTAIAALAAVGIGIATLFIMMKQNKIVHQQSEIFDKQNRILADQIKLDLFDKRFKVLETIYSIAADGLAGKTTKESMQQYSSTLEMAQFLFEEELWTYLKGKPMEDINLLMQNLWATGNPMLPEAQQIILKNERTEILRRMRANEAEIKPRFLPYLDFRKLS